jgi:predicted ATP-binding protein involved in virulence
MQVDYATVQKQLTDLLPKYALVTDVKNRNVKLAQELQDRTNELSLAK